MKKIFSLLIIFVCMLSGCSCSEEEVVRTAIFSPYITGYANKDKISAFAVEPFGTSQMTIVGYSEKKVYAIEEEYYKLVNKYHSLLDRHYYYFDGENLINNIKVINDSYGSGDSIVVDQIIIDVLKTGIEYSKLSNGKFNIFSGSLVNLWDERFDGYSQKYGIDPSEEEIREALECVVNVNDIDSIFIIDDENNTVTFNRLEGCNKSASITLGALAKSYFIDCISSLDEFKNIGSAIYSAGQSSIILKGDNPTRENGVWNIALNDSMNSNILFSVKLADLVLDGDQSLSTSGGEYKGYTNQDGVKRHHIIDAISGYPQNFIYGATVISDNATICDIVTTTLMTMNSLEEIKEYLILLETKGYVFDVLLQVNDEGSLKVMVNEGMKSNIKQVKDGIVVEEFSYGA